VYGLSLVLITIPIALLVPRRATFLASDTIFTVLVLTQCSFDIVDALDTPSHQEFLHFWFFDCLQVLLGMLTLYMDASIVDPDSSLDSRGVESVHVLGVRLILTSSQGVVDLLVGSILVAVCSLEVCIDPHPVVLGFSW
jgi:hypothetical protein